MRTLATKSRGTPAIGQPAFKRTPEVRRILNGPMEGEADATAQRAIATPAPEAAAAGATPSSGAGDAGGAAGGAAVQPSTNGAAAAMGPQGGAAPSDVAALVDRPDAGRPLSAALRAFAQPRFGADFTNVRVHDGTADRAAADRIGARAFTLRHDIWLGTGESAEDGRLMAHELTHVTQQTRRTDGPALAGRPGTDGVLRRQEIEQGSGKAPEAPAWNSETSLENAPVLRTKNKPPGGADYIVDLTKAAGVENELTKTTAKWLLVEVKEERWYIKVGEQGMAALLPELRAHILNAQRSFEPNTFFDWDGDTLTYGTAGTESLLTVDVKQAGNVLEESNARTEDAAWSFLNAGQSALHKEGVEKPGERVGPQEKPGAWYNYYFIEKEMVKTHLSPNDPRSKAAGGKRYQPPSMNLSAYGEMLKQDFNFGGVISACNAASTGPNGGESVFVEAILARGNLDVGNAADLAALAREIWSYATTGADTAGKTDIAEMQGLLFALDGRIQESSATNTPMSGGPFTLRGTGVKLNLGDGRHGRATTLTTRHLLADIKVTTRRPGSLVTGEETAEPLFSKQDRFIKDRSESMDSKNDAVDDAVKKLMEDEAKNFPGAPYQKQKMVRSQVGQMQDATFDDMSVTVKGGKATKPGLFKPKKYTDLTSKPWKDVLQDAYSYLYPGKTEKNATDFANLFGLPRDVVFDPTSTNYNLLDGERLNTTLGGTTTSYGSLGESGVKALIETLLYGPAYEDEKLKKLHESGRPRVNIVVDEHEQSLEYLQLAQALAGKKRLKVRVIAFPSKFESNGTVDEVPIIDLGSIKVTMNAVPEIIDGGPDYKVGTFTFDAVQNGVSLRGQTGIITKEEKFMGKEKFKGLRLVWRPGQEKSGSTN